MAGDAGSRPLLPQTTQAQSFPFLPTATPREPQQRNYVFVDEHNRHKRLKVMRACEGCRRRKIKCDAATTNTWPCAACTRLKLTCVPPTVSYEKESMAPGVHTFELQNDGMYSTSSVGTAADYQQQCLQHPYSTVDSALSTPLQTTYAELPVYQSATFVEPSAQDLLQYSSVPATTGPQDQTHAAMYATPLSESLPATSEHSWKSESGVSTLSDVMGDLKINPVAIAAYISDHQKLAETPAVEEYEMNLPNITSHDMRVRIPVEMMPSEHQALQYFDYFFSNIHPYVPVLSRQAFYQQWNTDREAISPLLLDAIFACTSSMLESHPEGNKWLALAARHEESFKDVPRLSTIQALCILMKAKESHPKRGYFYRSWMTVVNLVAMSKDLGMNQHYEDHRDGRPCGFSDAECVCRTRTWQLLYMLESMVGGPQGRVDYSASPDTVDFNEPQMMPGIDEREYQVSRQFAYLTNIARNIRETVKIYAHLRKKKEDWSLDPYFIAHDEDYLKWIRSVPRDLQVVFPQDGSSPWLPSPFVGNMHCYYYLSKIMHHRPQIHYLMEHSSGISWKPSMMLCLDAAQKMCRIQESMLHNHGFAGLMCMQRGMSFTIYSVLTCTMLHLAAITSPDPDLNRDGREFFVRHMRILEECTPTWPMLEMRVQIDTLREAFSADTSKPFELKPGFPLGSPTPQPESAPTSSNAAYSTATAQDMPHLAEGQVNYNMMQPITPPISTTEDDRSSNSPVAQQNRRLMSSQDHGTHGTQNAMQQSQGNVHAHWNPTPLFDQWNMAFNSPAARTTTEQPSPPLSDVPSAGDYDIRVEGLDLAQQTFAIQAYSPTTGQMQAPTQPPAPTSYPAEYVVSPSMWQDAVASSFGDRLKRRWDVAGAIAPMAKRSR